MQTNSDSQREVPRRRPQFTIGGLLLLMVVCSFMAAAGSYLVRSLQRPAGANRLIFILFTLLAPVVLVIVASLLRQATLWIRRRRRAGNGRG